MIEYELETDDFGLGFLSAYEKFIVEILEELPSETIIKKYRLKVQEIEKDDNNDKN